MIPFLSFEYQHSAIREEAIEVFRHFFDSQYYVLGPQTTRFEEQYAKLNEVAHCIGISNGFDALQIALRVLGVGAGDEVIVPSNTYIASALAVSFVGAKPVFVEPRPDTYNLNPHEIEDAITPCTKAILPVHLYGQACEMDAIMDVAQKFGLAVVEDNAQAHLARWNGQVTGSFGDLNATSFYPSKNLGALGEAGAITTQNAELAQAVKVMRNYGSQKRYFNEVKGLNARIDELQAALLQVKLKYLEAWTAERQQLAQVYLDKLSGVGDIILPAKHELATHVYHLFVVRTSKRDALQQYLNELGIGTLIHYPIPPHLQQAYQDLMHKKGDFPIAEMLAETSLSLPLYPGLGEEKTAVVAETIRTFFEG
jgi:dTDP-4-amino-4,6-dideoxygalactose transaminase